MNTRIRDKPGVSGMLWVSGMLEKQGQLKRRLLCLPSLLVHRKTGLDSKDGRAGRHWQALDYIQVAPTHHPMPSCSLCHGAGRRLEEKMWVWLIETLGVNGAQQPIAPPLLITFALKGRTSSRLKTE